MNLNASIEHYLMLTLLLAAITISTNSVQASDGALEINSICATQTGCFSDDPAGYPVQIKQSGSYKLTGNLLVPDADTSGIVISASNVTVDLNGFGIIRTGCEGENGCSIQNGSGSGIVSDGDNFSVNSVTVKNGSVSGMGRNGVALSATGGSLVENISVFYNGKEGITIATQSKVSASVSANNGSIGINTGTGCFIVGNIAYNNGGSGIQLNPGGVASNNTAYENESHGMLIVHSGTVTNNTLHDNEGHGIYGLSGESTIVGNTANYNDLSGIRCDSGCLISDNTVARNNTSGIAAYGGSLVHNNVSRSNIGHGLNLSVNGDTVYRANSMTSNSVGGVIGGTNRGQNYCAGTGVSSSFCP